MSTVDVSKLNRELSSYKIRLSTIQIHLNMVDAELESLKTLKARAEENLSFLKKAKLVAVAAQFKKGKEEIEKYTNRIRFLEGDKINFMRNMDNLNKEIKKIEETLKRDDTFRKQVIHLVPRRKDGQGRD